LTAEGWNPDLRGDLLSGRERSDDAFYRTNLWVAVKPGLLFRLVSLISSAAYGPVMDSGNANPDSNFRFNSNIYIFNLNITGLGTGIYNLYFRAAATLRCTQCSFKSGER